MVASFIKLGELRSFNREGRSLILDYGGPRVAITILTERIVRVRLAPEGAFAARRSWAVARADDEFPQASFEIEEQGQALQLRAGSFHVFIDRQQGNLSFTDAQDQLFCVDETGMQWESAASEPRRVACAKRIETGEHFFGFGERTGQLDKLGREMMNWTTDPPAGQDPAPTRSTWPFRFFWRCVQVWPTASSSITPGAVALTLEPVGPESGLWKPRAVNWTTM